VQEAMVHSIAGLEKAAILRYGYAIEYDYVPPMQTWATLECKMVGGLFLAGQINGTSGYEEAAGQGLLAGVNAARRAKRAEPAMLGRDNSYIGVMIDDLVTKGIDEPYRMFTSRAEYRLLLRGDNADVRLTPIRRQWGLVDDRRWEAFQNKQQQAAQARNYLENRRIDGKPLPQLLRQPERDEAWLFEQDASFREKYSLMALRQAGYDIRYSGYIEKQRRMIDRFRRLETMPLPVNFDYRTVKQLRFESQEKLNQVRPLTLGQASRISGINPADITVLMIYLDQKR
jgi:tRNA uridine 5-carboxymethylaminomethyl modification enzyme